MIEFKLHPIQPWVEWTHVFRSPDDICFTIRSENGQIETCESLSSILNLHKHVSEEGSMEGYKFQLRTCQGTENDVELVVSKATEELRIKTTYEELQSAVENLLKDAFKQLDEVSSTENRERAFARGDKDYVEDIYQSMMT